jgi:hypothetical protein
MGAMPSLARSTTATLRPVTRRGGSATLTILKRLYWAFAIALPVGLFFIVPAERVRLVFNEMTTMFYVIASAALYRLLLLFAWHVTDSDAVEREIQQSEGRVELHLDDRDR